MRRKLLLILLSGLFLVIICIYLTNRWVEQSTLHQVFSDAGLVPPSDVALVLGTSRLIDNHYLNPYFKNRITAAAELYHTGKVKHFILSGDNSKKTYNEPAEMEKALIESGVPKSAITLDYAGFRTLDSVIRANKIFQQERFTVVSQRFHNQRAVFIANKLGLEVTAYNAKTPVTHSTSSTHLREYLARCKAVIDLYILNQQPKFLGEKINLPI